MMCLGFFFFTCFLCLGSLVLNLWVYRIHQIGKILVMISSNIFFFISNPCPTSLLYSGDSNYIYVLLFKVVSQFTNALFILQVFFSLYISFQTVSIDRVRSSLIFSFSISNLVLIPSKSVLLNHRYCRFHQKDPNLLSESLLLSPRPPLNMINLSSGFLNIKNFFVILMLAFTNFFNCVISGLVFLLTMSCIFLLLFDWMRDCEFYLVGCSIFLYS